MRYTGCVEDLTHQPAVDVSRQAATGPGAPRPVATVPDGYISLKEAMTIFLAHDRPITDRTLQRSCVKGHITGQKVATGEGEKWFVLRSSVLTRIAELDKFDALRERPDAASRDVSRQVAEENQSDIDPDARRPASTSDVSEPVVPQQQSHSTPSDASRPAAASRDVSAGLERIEELYGQLVTAYKDQADGLRKDKEALQDDKKALLEQLVAKDRHIERFFASERETKTLFGRVTSMMNAIWPNKASPDLQIFETPLCR